MASPTLAPTSRALLVSIGSEAPAGESGRTFALLLHLTSRNAPKPTRTITTSTNFRKLLIMDTSHPSSAVLMPEDVYQRDNGHGTWTSISRSEVLFPVTRVPFTWERGRHATISV